MTCGLLARLISTTATMADGTAHYAEKVGDTQQYIYIYIYIYIITKNTEPYLFISF